MQIENCKSAPQIRSSIFNLHFSIFNLQSTNSTPTAMASIKSPGLVLRKIPYSETSLILKVYTRESGLVSLMAKGAKRAKSKFRGLLDYFNLNQFLYPDKSRSEMMTLTDAGLIREFPRLKSDPARQALAHVFMELFLKYVQEPHSSAPHYELLLEHFEGLDETDGGGPSSADFSLRLCDFLLGLSAVSGFSPQFSRCAQCGGAIAGLRVRMDPDLGGPLCASCAGHTAGPILPGRVLQWLDRIQLQGMMAGGQPKSDEMQAEAFLLAFLGKHAGGTRTLQSLDFYRQMLGAA
jgi:DNA repair protein RecO (recombination protein O)